jgi:hypothetical protein
MDNIELLRACINRDVSAIRLLLKDGYNNENEAINPLLLLLNWNMKKAFVFS